MSPFIFAALISIVGATDQPGEAPLVPGAIPLEEAGRYTSPRNYDDTVNYYQRYFRSKGGARWHHIVNLPSIKAKHIKSLRKSTLWEGINIYEAKGQVRFFVIPRAVPAPPRSGQKSR